MQSPSKPSLLWAQRTDRILLTVDVVDIKDEKITLDEKQLFFSGVGRDGARYEFQFELRNEVIPQESKHYVSARGVHFSIKKKEPGPYWPTLAKLKLPYLKVDFSKWKEEDDSDQDEDPSQDGLENLMQRMDMGQMGGAGGMGGLGGMGMGGLGGMGMGGLGGMGGPGGMNGGGFDPGDEEESDSDDEPIPGLSS